ncbi:phosphoribosylglycinamide formyltransferase [Vagococcus fluvialis]|uniref:phosphoribosylglycinamide formyltransferase n=1 Tax=Vagococcus fluvialis TaxID=2738 RepID=UPI003B5A315C
MRVAIFASGSGSNFQALSDSFKNKEIPGELVCLFCDQPNAYVIKRAEIANIPYFVLPKKKTESKSDYEQQIIHLLREARIDLIVLAGYMKILGADLLEAFPNRIINLHPSLLPKFPGANGIEDAFHSEDTETGITIHLVDQGVDTGPVIFQKKLSKLSGETLDELTNRIHKLEHEFYPKTIANFIRENVVE